MDRSFLELKVDASPALKLLGVRPRLINAGEIELELPFRSELCNIIGTIQGGFVTAVADAAGGWAIITALGSEYIAPTIEIKMNFLRPVTETMIARGKIINITSHIGTAYMEVFLESGSMAAVGLGTYRIVKLKR